MCVCCLKVVGGALFVGWVGLGFFFLVCYFEVEGIISVVLVWYGFGFKSSFIGMVEVRWYDRFGLCLGSGCFYYYSLVYSFTPLVVFCCCSGFKGFVYSISRIRVVPGREFVL